MRKTLVIAEIGHNWNGDIEIAKNMIAIAKFAGADVAKFQLYDTDKLEWGEGEYSEEIYNELKQSELTRAQLKTLKEECDRYDIEFMCSVFDVDRVKWTEKIGMKRYKIASRSIFNQKLIEEIAGTGKDMIVSLGFWDWERGFPHIENKMGYRNGKVDFLYCVSKYPTKWEELDIPCFEHTDYSGFSDHTEGIEASLVAVARGAKIIEKHFTLNRNMPGCDQINSIEPLELFDLIRKIEIIEKIL